MTSKKFMHPDSLLTRRTAVSGLALGGAGLMAAGMGVQPALAKTDWTLDLDSAEDNCKAMIKLQAGAQRRELPRIQHLRHWCQPRGIQAC